MNEPIKYATYDFEDNKLRIYSGRVSPELFERLRNLGFRRAYQQGCFFATWSPIREDVTLELCGEIDDEDTTLLDRADDRYTRFATYSENADRRMHERNRASSAAVEGIPLGQPILIGHHSEKRHRAALKKARDNATKANEERGKRDWWAYKAQAVKSNAGRKFRPDVILRRIKRLEAAKRKQERIRNEGIDRPWAIQRWIWALPDDEHDYHTRFEDLSQERQAECEAHLLACAEVTEIATTRWIVHLEGQIAFWSEVYDGGEKVAADEYDWDIQKGGWVKGRWGWGQVERITRRDGQILSVSLDRETLKDYWAPRIVKYPEIKDYSPERPVVESANA